MLYDGFHLKVYADGQALYFLKKDGCSGRYECAGHLANNVGYVVNQFYIGRRFKTSFLESTV